MIYSMTGYAKEKINKKWGSAIFEIRSFNHRYLEINLRLSEEFRELEPLIRQCIRSNLSRGKIECSLQFESNKYIISHRSINISLIKQLIKYIKYIKLNIPDGIINIIDLLNWPGVINLKNDNVNNIFFELSKLFQKTIKQLLKFRKNEGINLKKLIAEKLFFIKNNVSDIRNNITQIVKWQKKRILEKIEELKIDIDPNRLNQELFFIIQKTDISEELDRIDIHVLKTISILENNEPIGRKLDFIMQELNREVNTLSSKSSNFDIHSSVIEIKVLIEQIREQSQNIE
ncbi:MAG: YicC/YloC family endoribonuclease [Buchnera aphidicola (Meitanaphis flavogallis)]